MPTGRIPLKLFLKQEFAEGVLKDHGLDPKENQAQLEALIEEIKNTVSAEKARIRAAKAAWQAKLDALGPEKRKALDELKIWKYYPQNEHPDISGNKARFLSITPGLGGDLTR